MNFLSLDERLNDALLEDLGRGDVTTDAVLSAVTQNGRLATARVVAKENLVLAGWPVLTRVFRLLGHVEDKVFYGEGDCVPRQADIGEVRGEASVLLKGERVALNILQRMSGIATETRQFVDMVAHTGARVMDTRKTTPLWRDLEKYAVRAGGGHSHRQGLDDGILIKENHISVAGGIARAVEACRKTGSHLHRVEVEVQTLEELQQALEVGVEVILLDNMSPEQVRDAVALINRRSRVEVSGGIRLDNVLAYAEAGADFISLGALTHSYRSRDISILLHI